MTAAPARERTDPFADVFGASRGLGAAARVARSQGELHISCQRARFDTETIGGVDDRWFLVVDEDQAINRPYATHADAASEARRLNREAGLPEEGVVVVVTTGGYTVSGEAADVRGAAGRVLQTMRLTTGALVGAFAGCSDSDALTLCLEALDIGA